MKPLQPLPAKKQIEGKKHLIIAVLLVCVAGAFWYNVHSFLTDGVQFNPGRLSQLAATLLLFGLMNGLVGIIGFSFRNFNTRLVVYFAGIVPHFLFFGVTYYSIVTAVLLWLFWVRYGRNTEWEEKERIHFHAMKILTHTLGTLLTFSLFALAFAYYGVVTQDQHQSGRLIDRLADTATNAVIVVFSSTTDEFDPDMSVNTFIDRYAGENIKELFPTDLLPENLGALLEERPDGEAGTNRQPLTDEQLAEFRDVLLTEFGIETTGNEPIRDVIGEIVRDRVDTVMSPYEKYIPPILAGSLFLTLSAFSVIYFWFTVLLGWFMTKILFWARVLKIEQHTTPVDQLIVE